ncbi:hypothetical protein AURDEDRAFT_126064 [Auricularia subglabra TFB-10046 SS5]|nr:hypothetical protein AURDEDRAFT_126064 [Auricularia subglabra TFB-10046 SS5]
MRLDTVRISVYDYVQSLLGSAGNREPSSAVVEGLLDTVRSAVHAACADFAEGWNREHGCPVVDCLPVEILTMCFHEAQFEARITASHVSRKWRAVALSDGALWSTYRRKEPKVDSTGPTKAMVIQLSALLERSRPYPFNFILPEFGPRLHVLEGPLSAALYSERGRVQEYDGPFCIFQGMRPENAPMPALRSLRLTCPMHKASFTTTRDKRIFNLPRCWGDTSGSPMMLSEIDLVGMVLGAQLSGPPLTALTRLTFHAAPRAAVYMSLFQRCPNLVSLYLRDVRDATPLPQGPLPPSLQTVSLYHCDGSRTDFTASLDPWRGCVIPQLELHGSSTISQPLAFFLPWCAGPVAMTVTRNSISMRPQTENHPLHTAYPYSWSGDDFHALRGACAARLAAISINMCHLDELFEANLVTPVLRKIEVVLESNSTGKLMRGDLPQPSYGLAAPQLCEVITTAAISISIRAGRADDVLHTTHVLRSHLRDLIFYDAALLERITARGRAEVLAFLGCAGFAPLASTNAYNGNLKFGSKFEKVVRVVT